VAGLALGASCGFSMAHEGAMGITKERMDLMKAVRDDMKTIAAMLKGEQNFNASQLHHHAEKIREAADMMLLLFPESDKPDPVSEARHTIWTNWQDFEREALNMKEAAQKLMFLAAQDYTTPQDLSLPFRELGLTCSSCHDSYRDKR
jgi:cytochrome c556